MSISCRSWRSRCRTPSTRAVSSATDPAASNSASRSRPASMPSTASRVHHSSMPQQWNTIWYAELAPGSDGRMLTRWSPRSVAMATIRSRCRSTMNHHHSAASEAWRSAVTSVDPPGVATCEQCGEVAGAGFGCRVLDLLVDLVVVGRTLDRTEDADRRHTLVDVAETRQHERERRLLVSDIVDQQGALVALVDIDDLEAAVPGEPDTLLQVRPEPDRLALLEADDGAVAGLRLLQHVKGTVVEDVAVLQDLHERGAAVLAGGPQHRSQVLAVGVDGAGEERGFGAPGERDRIDRRVHGAGRRRLGDLADLRRGGVLALGQPVDAVVEHQQLEVDVAPQDVDQVVAADRHEVAVAAHHPHRQVGTGGREAGRDGRRPPVDRVHAVGVEVVGEPGRAADAGDADDVLALQPELGQERLHRGEDRVVTATRAPSDLLVGGVLLLRRLLAGERDEVEPARALLGDAHTSTTPPATQKWCSLRSLMLRSRPGSRRRAPRT